MGTFAKLGVRSAGAWSVVDVGRRDSDRFWASVDCKPTIRECWEWRGTRNPAGCGIHPARGHVFLAHRFAYCCDNTACVNPRHLVLGTSSDNRRDAHLSKWLLRISARQRGTKVPAVAKRRSARREAT